MNTVKSVLKGPDMTTCNKIKKTKGMLMTKQQTNKNRYNRHRITTTPELHVPDL